jgi:type III secretion protein L
MAKLIKRDDAGEETQVGEGPQSGLGRRGPVIDRDTFEAKSDAQQIRERAEAQAAQLQAETQEEAAKIVSQAHEEAQAIKATAYEEGLRAGREEGSQALIEATLRANSDIAALQDTLVPQIKTLAMAIARRVIGRELEFHPEAVVEIVKQALGDKARQRREITLRVHPDDAQMLRDSRADLLDMLSRCKEISIREDEEIAPHGVIIETEAGIIDAQLETQLGVLERLLASMP